MPTEPIAFWPEGLLLSPWTHVSVVSQAFLVAQIAALLTGCWPVARRRLGRMSWLVAWLVGPPLVWSLLEISVGLVLSFHDAFNHYFSLRSLYDWLLRLPLILGTVVLLQSALALQYARDALRAFPVLGIALGLIAILGDIVFVLVMVTPLNF